MAILSFYGWGEGRDKKRPKQMQLCLQLLYSTSVCRVVFGHFIMHSFVTLPFPNSVSLEDYCV